MKHIFKWNIILFVASFCLVVLFSACYESEPVPTSGEVHIFKLQDTNVYYSDTLVLYGENLGQPADSSYLVFNDSTIISSTACLEWTASKIAIIVPKLPANSSVCVVVNAKKIAYNGQHYEQYLSVKAYPPFDYVLVPAGKFDMGSDAFSISDEQPVHSVQIVTPLYVSSYEVSQHLYSVLMDANPSDLQHENYPVYNVSWIDAIRFCNALSLAVGLAPAYTIIESPFYVSFSATANGWRLPTEAEWEYFSNIDETLLADSFSDYAWFSGNSALTPKTIGRLKPNSFGLYDVLGNVWEWCWDYYSANYYSTSPVASPTGPTTGIYRAIRGGSCDDGKIIVRSSYRAGCLNINSDTKIGFRIVRRAE